MDKVFKEATVGDFCGTILAFTWK